MNTNLTFRYTGGNYSGPFRLIAKNSAGAEVGGGSSTLTVQRAGISLSFQGSNSVLRPNSTLDLNVSAYSVGGFTGDVTFSATDLPAGVTVTPVTKTLNGAAFATISLKAADVVPGTYKITLTADGGNGRTASTKVDITVPKPGVTLSVSSYGSVAVYQGSGGTVSVDVKGVEGFSGATTVTLADLPAGVTATPKSVTVTQDATTTVQIPVQVAADAGLGEATVRLTSPDLAANAQNTTATLSIRPARTQLSGSASQSIRATEGVWAVTGGQYDNTAGIYMSTLTRFTMGVQLPRPACPVHPRT
ncbi:hypothetical protein [Deinococcus multiflagellatus]|uniref:Uncharacterized protein n=1 Tax=Deinococcus multiflagellatus TaxID=1656887 RepID=A0ABW1ZH54_9DEIO